MAKKKLAQAADYAAATFVASLSSKQVEVMEQSANSPDHGCARRIGLHVLCRSKRQLMEHMDKDVAAAFLSAYDAVHAYVQHLDAVRSLMHTAEVRLMVVLHSATQADPDLANVEVDEVQP